MKTQRWLKEMGGLTRKRNLMIIIGHPRKRPHCEGDIWADFKEMWVNTGKNQCKCCNAGWCLVHWYLEGFHVAVVWCEGKSNTEMSSLRKWVEDKPQRVKLCKDFVLSLSKMQNYFWMMSWVLTWSYIHFKRIFLYKRAHEEVEKLRRLLQ